MAKFFLKAAKKDKSTLKALGNFTCKRSVFTAVNDGANKKQCSKIKKSIELTIKQELVLRMQIQTLKKKSEQ